MMVLPDASAPPAVGVKVSVAATPVLAATRSAVAMANVTTVGERAVKHVEQVYMSTAFEKIPSVATIMKRQAHTAQAQATTRQHSQTRIKNAGKYHSHSSFSIKQNALPDSPPANIHTFPTDAAARYLRATLSRAVDQTPVALLYKSTALDAPPAVALMRRQALVKHTQQHGTTHKS